ncbi:ATP-binding cassette sub-family B member 9 isoform X3 [Trichomycterus rosablanca]|uniref:ATP-binding cassette sub-family B member 9 isoform X3 n=1 Tax=Trichomycterus rosablanca TaxID=2290929 RepID=UPI002F35724F
MRLIVVVSCIVTFVVVDVVLSTVFYIQGSGPNPFSEDLEDFNIYQSILDLWATLMVRSCLLLGAAIGILVNRTEGPCRVASLGTLVVLVSLVMLTYALTKLLIFSEIGRLMYNPWFLSLFSWTCASSVGTMVLWKLLSRTDGGAAGGERVRLDEGDEEDEDGTRGTGDKERVNSGATLGRLLYYCKKDAGLLSLAFFFLLLSAVCEAFIPYYTGKAIDGIVIHKSMEYFTKPMIVLSGLALVSSLAIGVRGGVFSLTLARLNIRLRNLLFRTLMQQEIGFFDANHTGDITSRLTSDTTQVSDLISQNLNLFLRSFVKGVGFFGFMFSMSWKLSLVTILGFPYIAVLSKLYGDYYKKLTKEVQTSLAHANKVAEETISAMKTVRSFAGEGHEAESYHARLQEVFALNKKQAVAFACFMWSTCISELALQVTILFYGGHLVVTDQMTGGALISFFIYELELGECLENVSFRIQPGEVTALVGPSGSGKSSCVSLLENFYWPQHGQVLLDGRPVQMYQHGYLHSKVALVGQEPVLFARTVQKNICYGLPDAPPEVVASAARKANAHNFICGLSKGYDTGVGEKGAQLSGGQKQRVAIARALIRNPRVLILDEATSALDAESEHVVQQALDTVLQNHTVLVIAHRLSTVQRANTIVVLEDGVVMEQGCHDKLMDLKGLYYRLVQRQMLGFESNGGPPRPAIEAPPSQKEEEQEGSGDEDVPRY